MKKFEENINTAVFTTSFVVTGKNEITYVTHEIEDGAWQFFSNDKFENYEDVAMIVSLGEIIELDNTLLDLADLPLGYTASRQSVRDTWERRKI